MARLGSGGDVAIRIGTHYGAEGVREAKSSMDSLGEHLNKIKAKWLEIAAASYTVKKAWDLAFNAAQFQQQQQAFANLAASHGANSARIISDLKAMSAQTIATADVMQSAGKAMLLGIPAEKLSKMMEIARASSRITGQTVQQAFDDIAMGVGRQSKVILDNLGIIVNLDKAYENYAKSIKKSASQLSELEKRQAFVNEVMKAGEDTIRRVGELHLTQAEAMQASIAKLKDMAIFVGKIIAFVGDGVAGLLTAVSSGLWKIVAEGLRALAWLVEKASVLPFVGDKLRGFSESLNQAADVAEETSISQAGLAMEFFNMADALFRGVEATVKATQTMEDNTAAGREGGKVYEQNEGKITALVLATEALNASKARALELAVLEYSLGGATIEQIERYTQALKELEEQKLLSDMAGQKPGGGPSMSMAIPETLSPLTGEEEAHKRMLQRKAEEGEAFLRTNEEIMRSEQVRANMVGIAYQAMQDQMLSLIETGKFSVKEMSKVIAQQVKIELTGIAARAVVWAIFHTAMGIGRAAFGDAKGASLHFASAAQFAATAGMAMAGAAVTHAMFGGTAERPAPSPVYGADPYTGSPTTAQAAAAEARPQIVFRVEKMELLDEDSVDRLIARINERVTGYDVVLEAGA